MTRIAMIGGGPKCLFALLELNDSLAAGAAHLLHVDVYDPYPPGAGRVWNTGQPRELRLNVNSRIIDASWSLCAQTFNQFRDRQPAGAIHDPFPPRALVGEYLREQFELLAHRGSLPVRHLALAVEKLERQGDQWLVKTGSGSLLYDEVVIATGHGLAGSKQSHTDLAPIAAASLSVEQSQEALRSVPAGSSVWIRGAALTAYDVVLALTEGRGGHWKPAEGGPGGTLEYLPSGREPQAITMASRHRIPMTPKPASIPPETQGILDACKAQLRRWGSLGPKETGQMWRILLDCAIQVAALNSVPASEESLSQTLETGQSAQFSTQSSPFEQVGYSLLAHQGLKPQTQEWVWAAVWSGVYPELIAALSRFHWTGPERKEFNAAAANLERMAFGPPIPTAQKLMALHDAGMLRHEPASPGPPEGAVKIDAVTSPAGVLTAAFPEGEPASGLIQGLLADGEIKIRTGERGLLTDTDGTCINAQGLRNESLAALGRPTEDPTLGHDTLNRGLHPEYQRWSQRILAQLNTPSQKAAY